MSDFDNVDFDEWFSDGVTRLDRLTSRSKGDEDDAVEKIVELFESRTKYSFLDDMDRSDALENMFTEAKLAHLIPKDSHRMNYETLRSSIMGNFNSRYGRKGKKKNKKTPKVPDNSVKGVIGLVERITDGDREMKTDRLALENNENQNVKALYECREELQKTLREIEALTKDKEDLIAKNWELQTENEMLEKILEAKGAENRITLSNLENCKELLEKTLNEVQIKDHIINELNIKLKDSETCNNKFENNIKELDKARDKIKNQDKIIADLNGKLVHIDIREKDRKHVETKCTKNHGIRSAVVLDLTKRIAKVTDELKNVSGNLKKLNDYAKNSNRTYSNKFSERYIWINPNIESEQSLKFKHYYQFRKRYVWINPNIQSQQNLKCKQNENRKIIDENLKSTEVNIKRPLKDEMEDSGDIPSNESSDDSCPLEGIKNIIAEMSEKVPSSSGNNLNNIEKENCVIGLVGILPNDNQERKMLRENLRENQSENENIKNTQFDDGVENLVIAEESSYMLKNGPIYLIEERN